MNNDYQYVGADSMMNNNRFEPGSSRTSVIHATTGPLSISHHERLCYCFLHSTSHNKSSAVAEMDDRLDTIDMGRKEVGGCCAHFVELGLYLTQCGLGRDLPPYQVTSWSIQPFVHNTRTSQTDRQTGQRRQRSDSIGRTVLQTLAQKQCSLVD